MQRGFSLVELSIVLVILGLLTGGILAGQSLIRTAELRAVSNQVGAYATAVSTFREQYAGLPGDLPSATRFWPVNPSGCPSGGGVTGTCDGDGDGNISLIAAAGVTNRGCEDTEVWKHLAFAGLISGSYETPTYANCYGALALGTNIPRAKLNNAYWDVMHLAYPLTGAGPGSPGGTFFAETRGNVLVLAGGGSSNHWVTTPAAITAEEAWNIDTKMDDGKPSTGLVMVPRDTSTGGLNCVDETAAGGPAFELTMAQSRCTLLFMNIFQ